MLIEVVRSPNNCQKEQYCQPYDQLPIFLYNTLMADKKKLNICFYSLTYTNNETTKWKDYIIITNKTS